MKNKPITYLLIVSVAAVWGIIFYRMFSGTGNEEMDRRPTVRLGSVNESLDDYKFKDTFKLALNYRDPFLGNLLNKIETAPVENIAENSSAVAFIRPKPIKPQINWEMIKYNGCIINPLGKRVVAIMIINGKEQMLLEGQTADGVKLLKNYKDSIKVYYQSQIKFIRLQE